ncbi:MAG: segregation/condensation protein A [Candidatus Pacebacteria bacterium]|nr:segregation/condensation protein A [Candidatus Paceibacterota bacterium]MBP9840539.1 segregation/condensation protein A [Candidatus Paceibacterota bacterium]
MGENLSILPKTNYTLRTAAYEGPFELVLDLIERKQMLVNELSLAEVTDDFIQQVRGKAEFPMEDATNFIAVAATLLLIKSKSLIPELELSKDEEESMDELQKRLALYEKAREAARELSRLIGRSVMIEAGEREPEPVFAPAKDMTLFALSNALHEALSALEKLDVKPEVRVKSTVTIEEMMDSLMTRVQGALTLSFKQFSGSAKDKVEVIVSFLALLELVKQGSIEAAQQSDFGDITLSNASASVPRYG